MSNVDGDVSSTAQACTTLRSSCDATTGDAFRQPAALPCRAHRQFVYDDLSSGTSGAGRNLADMRPLSTWSESLEERLEATGSHSRSGMGISETMNEPLPIQVEDDDGEVDEEHHQMVEGTCQTSPWLGVGRELSTEMMQGKTSVATGHCDIFLCHSHTNATDTIHSMLDCIKDLRPDAQIVSDAGFVLEEGLSQLQGHMQPLIKKCVNACGVFLFFITDGVLHSTMCEQELRWAVEQEKPVILVRETDPKHGGIEMGDFFDQVPEDLSWLFKDNIAIPWFRERCFRNVSVQTILKRARMEDTYAHELERLRETKEALGAILRKQEHPTTCFDVIQERSMILRVVIFMGGFAQFACPRKQLVYNIVFNMIFWTCGAFCMLNLYYRDVPYHLLPTDFLTAYVHIPAWQSWLTWRGYVASASCTELLARVQASKERQANMDLALRIGSWLVLVLQVAMIADGLAGFSWPGTVHSQQQFGCLHSIVMWVITPPLIAVMFTCYVMFAFIALLHLLDILAMKDLLSQSVGPLAGYYDMPGRGSKLARGADALTAAAFGDLTTSDAEDRLLEWQRKGALEDNLFKLVADLAGTLVSSAQWRIDQTCAAVGSLWVHMVLFSLLQVLAISSTFKMHADGRMDTYHWWWGCQDFFHLGGGIVLLGAAMGVFCIVTWVVESVPSFAQDLFAKAGCPVSRQAGILGLLGARPLGMHIFGGYCFIDVPKAVGFFFILFLILGNKTLKIFHEIEWPVT